MNFKNGNLENNNIIILTPSTGISEWIGSIFHYSGDILPEGYLWCDGATYNINDYQNLFDIIRNNFGGDFSLNTFRVPDLRGLFLRGLDKSGILDPNFTTRTTLNGGNIGPNVGSYQGEEMILHTHNLSPNNTHTHYQSAPYQGDHNWWGTGSDFRKLNQYSGYTSYTYLSISNSGSNETRPDNIYVNHIIKI